MSSDSKPQIGHVSRIAIEKIPPFTSRTEIVVDPKVNVFIGANSTGKTTILRLIKSKGPGRPESSIRPRFGYIADREGRIGDVFTNSEEGEILAQTVTDVPIIWIPSSRVPLVPELYAGPAYGQYSDDFHGLDDISDLTNVLFATDVSAAISYHFRNIRDEESIVRIFDVVTTAFECVREIYPEMISRDQPDSYVDFGFVTHPKDNRNIRIPVVRYLMGLTISDNPNRITNISELSSGTQLSYMWIIYAALRMAYFYQWQSDWHKQPAILCVDEIDNHLHPAWQRKILRALGRHFPNVQIFATTHSPFIVAGLKSGQVHILARDQDGTVRSETKGTDMIAYTADEILSDIMGIDHPTDIETAEAAQILTYLRDLGFIDGLAEDWRQDEIKRFTELEKGDATGNELMVLNWLSGGDRSFISLPPALEGDAEAWRRAMIEEFEDELGANILSGGAVRLQRQWLIEHGRELDEDAENTVGDPEEKE